MITPEYDQTYLESALDALPRYLTSPTLYWPLDLKAPHDAPPYPPLTVGNVLLALRRLQAHHADTSYREKLGAIKAQWGANWRAKAKQEAQARLRQWKAYLEDSADRAPYYRAQVRTRVLLQLLDEELDGLPADVAAALRTLDERLRMAFRPGKFVWDERLQAAFPREPYWFLYGTLMDAN